MKRIDGHGATPDNRFTEGDPQAGVPATTVTADWLNHVQEELANLLESLGVALDPEKKDQVATLIGADPGRIPLVGALGAGFRNLIVLRPGMDGAQLPEGVTKIGETEYEWVVPEKTTRCFAEVIGGGGAGSADQHDVDDRSSPGGGAGGYVSGFRALTPGEKIPIVVGHGGKGVVKERGDDGEDSSFAGQMVADGGARGMTVSAGGGGDASGGDLNIPGGGGGPGGAVSGGAGGSNPRGFGGRGSNPGADGGSGFGGGGAGIGVSGDETHPGGDGADGGVLIWY